MDLFMAWLGPAILTLKFSEISDQKKEGNLNLLCGQATTNRKQVILVKMARGANEIV